QGRPVAGQEIRLLVATGDGVAGRTFLVRKAVSGGDGSFTFTRVDAGTYPVIAVRGTEVANATAVIASPLRSAVVTLRLVAPNGRASGRVVDEMGAPAAAKVSLKAMIPNAAGVLEFGDAGTIISDPDRGFTFTNIFPGPFTVTASSFFSAADATRSGRLSPPDPVADNIVLTLAANTARVGGCVVNPDGSPLQPLRGTDGAMLALPVFITSNLLRNERRKEDPEADGIQVDASNGCYESSIPLPPDFYTIQVTDEREASPTLGLTAQATLTLEKGAQARQDLRLLGLGNLNVEVVDASGAPVRGVHVKVQRTTYPNDAAEGAIADSSPRVFRGLTEGPVDVSAVVSSDPSVDVG